MKPELYANGATTTLSSGINNFVTSLSVVSATGFPTQAGQFRIIIDSEIILVTLVSGTTFTIIRGAEGTTAASHSSGAIVTQILTAASVQRASQLSFGPGNLPIGRQLTAKVENHTVTSSGTYTAFNNNSLGAGYITSMWLAGSSSDAAGREASRIKIYRDGAGSPDIDNTFAGLHAAFYGPAAFNTNWIGWVPTGSYNNYFKIPFSTGFKIDLVNGSSSASTNMFLVVSYTLTPVAFDWGRFARFKTLENSQQNVAPNSIITLLNTAGRGSFFGLYQVWEDSINTNFHFMEGNHQFYIDSEITPSLEWSGTEDYYQNAGYFNGGVLPGPHTGTVVKNGTNYCGAYRFHDYDPIIFDSNFQLDWNCGDTSQASMGGNLSNTIWTAYYYLDQ